MSKAIVEQTDVSVLMCDVDHFKRINDQYGHDVGDQALMLFATALREAIREDDICARIGGEEFVVVAPHTNEWDAVMLANRLRKTLEMHSELVIERFTVSIGVACLQDSGQGLSDLLLHADKALYAAKTAGRDCVRTWQQLPEEVNYSVSRGAFWPEDGGA